MHYDLICYGIDYVMVQLFKNTYMASMYTHYSVDAVHHNHLLASQQKADHYYNS